MTAESTPPRSHAPRTLVIHHRSGIGDLIWHIPYLRAIAASSANNKITLIARPSCRAADVLAAEDCIEAVIEFDHKPRKSEARHGKHDSWQAQLDFVRELRRLKFERVYIFSSRVRYAILAILAGIPVRAGFGFSAVERLLLNHPPFVRPHTGEGNWVYPEATEFSLAHGFAKAPIAPKMRVLRTALDAAEQSLHMLPRPRYAFSIGTSDPRKHWGNERYADLTRHLIQRGINVVLLGGPAETGVAKEIIGYLPIDLQHNVVAVTQSSIQFSAAILRHCDFCLGNDTGVLNMAVANDIPALGLFGSTPPLTHDPLMHALQAPNMEAITVEAILVKLEEIRAPGFAE